MNQTLTFSFLGQHIKGAGLHQNLSPAQSLYTRNNAKYQLRVNTIFWWSLGADCDT